MNQSDHPYDVTFDPDHGLQFNDTGATPRRRAPKMQLSTKAYQKTGGKGGKKGGKKGGGKKGSKKR